MNAGGYMLQAVTDEKENRTIEILATSLRPEELIGGKAAGTDERGADATGDLGCDWRRCSAWWLRRSSLACKACSVPWSFLVVVALFFVPAYALIAGMMTAIGAAGHRFAPGSADHGHPQYALHVAVLLRCADDGEAEQSHHRSADVVSRRRPSSLIALRWSMTVVPLWQLAVSWTLLVASAVVSVWLAARIFRIGMLRYGQQLSVKYPDRCAAAARSEESRFCKAETLRLRCALLRVTTK